MLRKIVRLLFGGEEETPEEVKPGEAAEDGWLVVNHQGRRRLKTSKSIDIKHYKSICSS